MNRYSTSCYKPNVNHASPTSGQPGRGESHKSSTGSVSKLTKNTTSVLPVTHVAVFYSSPKMGVGGEGRLLQGEYLEGPQQKRSSTAGGGGGQRGTCSYSSRGIVADGENTHTYMPSLEKIEHIYDTLSYRQGSK